MGYLSKLNAVNMMLLASGESLVADLNEASGIDTGIAEFLLGQVSMSHQLRGQFDNKIVKKITLTETGTIQLGYPNADYEGVLSASLVVPVLSTVLNCSIQSRVTEANPPELYNMTDQTNQWAAGDYYVEIIALLNWENLDTSSQRAILAEAMRKYQMMTQGDQYTDRLLAEDQAIAKIKSKADNVNDSQWNILWSNPTAREAVYRNMYTNPRYWNGGM